MRRVRPEKLGGSSEYVESDTLLELLGSYLHYHFYYRKSGALRCRTVLGLYAWDRLLDQLGVPVEGDLCDK